MEREIDEDEELQEEEEEVVDGEGLGLEFVELMAVNAPSTLVTVPREGAAQVAVGGNVTNATTKRKKNAWPKDQTIGFRVRALAVKVLNTKSIKIYIMWRALAWGFQKIESCVIYGTVTRYEPAKKATADGAKKSVGARYCVTWDFNKGVGNDVAHSQVKLEFVSAADDVDQKTPPGGRMTVIADRVAFLSNIAPGERDMADNRDDIEYNESLHFGNIKWDEETNVVDDLTGLCDINNPNLQTRITLSEDFPQNNILRSFFTAFPVKSN
jgi:hypothetical protein